MKECRPSARVRVGRAVNAGSAPSRRDIAWSEPVFSVIPPQRGHGLYARKTPQGRGLRGRCKHEQAVHQVLDAARDANMSTFDLRARRLARRSSAASAGASGTSREGPKWAASPNERLAEKKIQTGGAGSLLGAGVLLGRPLP